MDFTQLTQLIGAYGFPTACCLYMMYNNNKTVAKMSEIVQQNTVSTNQAVTQLGNLVSQLNTFLSTLTNHNKVGE